MDWNLASQVATALGTLIAAGSLGAGFQLYRISKRDEYVASLRKALADSRANCHRLRQLMAYDLANEIVNSVVYSPDVEVALDEIFERFFRLDSFDEAVWTEYSTEQFPVITTAIRSPAVEKYEEVLFATESTIAQYQVDYPGLFRVLRSTLTLFQNAITGNKELIRNEDMWRKIIKDALLPRRSSIGSVQKLKRELAEFLVGLSQKHMEATDKQVVSLLSVIDLVTDAYLARSERNLIAISRKERKQVLIPMSKTETITQDLREAEKCLRLVLSQDDALNYRESVARIEARGGS